MNDMTTTEAKATTRTYYVQSVAGGSPRLIRAKSVAEVRDYLLHDAWTDPRPARIEDMERAMEAGARVEHA